MTNEEKIIAEFYKVKEMEWVESKRRNNTGIGKTLEDYIGVVENNLNEPDLYGFEIKSHRSASSSLVTLFTKSPSYPRGANGKLKNAYGEPYPQNPSLKNLHTSMFGNSYNTYMNRLSFKLINDRTQQKLFIGIYSLANGGLINSSDYYNYCDIEKTLKTKLKNLLYVDAKSEMRGNKEWFKFENATIYYEPSFDAFLNMIDNGYIRYDIRIGSYDTGKTHDHGSAFRVDEYNILMLYKFKIDIK